MTEPVNQELLVFDIAKAMYSKLGGKHPASYKQKMIGGIIKRLFTVIYINSDNIQMQEIFNESINELPPDYIKQFKELKAAYSGGNTI
jgi:hypothetical protein